MKPEIWLLSSCALILILTGCTNNKTPDATVGTGPFDANGTYRDDWADDPSKWRKPGRRDMTPAPADEIPAIAKNEQPPSNATPLAPAQPSDTTTITKVTSKPTKPVVESAPRESTVKRTVKHTEEPKRVVTRTKPKPKPVVKAKPKPKKSTVTRYTVKAGDSLSKIAARNGSSVTAIQRENNISGTMIRPGQSLVIPKR